MIYYFLVFISVAILALALKLLMKPFFSFVYATSVLLNSMLDSGKDEKAKQRSLLSSLGKMLPRFGGILLLTVVAVVVSILPVIIYIKGFNSFSVDDIDMKSIWFFLSMLLGSFVLLINPKKKREDYSPWSKLLHRMILDNYNISMTLFHMEKRFYKKKLAREDQNFLIVSGLARGGTTALTNLLYDTDRFHSLSYDNMPFLLSLNTWRKFYKPKKNNLKERAHGDNILFGYDTIEALEEYFYKVHLNDSFIDSKQLKRHNISAEIYQAYREYQKLVQVKEGSIYLAKNNNLMLRYDSMRELDKEFNLLLIFRSPLEHAYSLLNQHKRFSKVQEDDKFTLEYMNWLGHHEFGLNHKVFDLPGMEKRERYEQDSLNYWLHVWISYYRYVISLPEDPSLIIVDYSDLCQQPMRLLEALGNQIGLDMHIPERDGYPERQMKKLQYDEEVLSEAEEIHESLKQKRFRV